MSTKIRVNREFASLQEAAEYFNYFLSKHPDARISLTDLKKVADKNGWTMEDQAIDNNSYRTVMSDSEGLELGITMVPHFDVFQPDTDDGIEVEFEDDDQEEESDDSDEAEQEDDTAAEEQPTIEETFAWVQPGETFVWRDPEDDSEHSAEVVEVKSDDGKVHSTTTEIRAKVEGIDGVISIFCDEIVMLDGDEEESEEEAEDSEEDSEDDSEDDPEPSDPNEVEDAEIVEDEKDDPDPSEDNDDE